MLFPSKDPPVVMMLLSATLLSGFAPTPVPCEPVCDWSTHDFKLVGKEMACVARDPDADEYLFYTMEVGKCGEERQHDARGL